MAIAALVWLAGMMAPWRGTARSPWSASGGGWQGRSPWRAMSGWRTTSPPPACGGCSVRGSTSLRPAEGERSYILLHERRPYPPAGPHRKADRLCGAVASTGFNPLVWLAFVLLGRDMEMSCDEAVLKKLGGVRPGGLLRLPAESGYRPADHRRDASGLRRGRHRSRVKNVLRWRRPRTGLVLLAAAVCVAVIAACAANPREDGERSRESWPAPMPAWRISSGRPCPQTR